MYKLAQSQVVLEQYINETVPVYSDAKDFIICEIRSTIQHEAAHRSQEVNWQKSDSESRVTFKQLTDPSRVEVEPERAEEKCVQPDVVSGQVENVNINDLFEKAKMQANIDPSWKNDILAATLAEGRAGEYLMKSLSPEQLEEAEQIGSGVYKQGNKLLIDVRKHIEPWMADGQKGLPPTSQTAADGAVTSDTNVTQPTGDGRPGVVPPVPNVPSIPSII